MERESGARFLAFSIGKSLSRHRITREGWKHILYKQAILRKHVLGVSDEVQHKPDCLTTKDSKRLAIT